MSFLAGTASEISEPVTANTRSPLSVRKAFDAAFGRSSDNPFFQKMINEFPFHRLIQPGKGLLMKLFMLEALNASENERKSCYAEIRTAFEVILKQQVIAKAILKQEPKDIRPAGSAPVTPDEVERQTAAKINDTASVLSSIIPPGSIYEDLRKVMLPLVDKFKGATKTQSASPIEVRLFYDLILQAPPIPA